ncbi:transcriptional regulator [Saccharomonospora sp. CUA-673]|nr:transcriptional regulator [Saccharomonospora sp. CUA-673]
MALASVVVLTLSWYGWQFIGDVNSGLTTTDVFGDDTVAAEPLDGAIDILLVGQDSRTDAQGNPLPREVLDKLHAGDDDGEQQTDTMILVHIPQDGRGAVAISFPRDAWVELPDGYGENRLNSAFGAAYNHTAGELRQDGDVDEDEIDERATVAGRKNLINAVEKLVDRPGMIDRYAEVNLASFYEITSALGGVDVCLNDDVHDRRSGVDLSAGEHTLEGAEALGFVRQRYGLPNGDLDRIARQQAFLSGLVQKMLSSDVLFDPGSIRDVVQSVQRSVVLSEDWDLMQFAAQMRNLSGGNVEFRTIPVEGNAWFGNALAIELDVDEVRSFVDDVVGSPRADDDESDVDASEYTAYVYNGSADPAMGDTVRNLLADTGFQGEGSAGVDGSLGTVVRHAPGDEDAAEAAADTLGGDVEVQESPEVPQGQIDVYVGPGFSPGESGGDGSGAEAGAGPSVAPAALVEPAQSPSTTESDGSDGQTEESTTPEEPITAGDIPCVN